MLRYVTIASLIGLIVLGGYAMMLRGDNADLRKKNADLQASIEAYEDRAQLAQDALKVAQAAREAAEVQAAKYETVRDAFRKGDFDAPLPDDFRHLVACLLRRGIDPGRTDCSNGPR